MAHVEISQGSRPDRIIRTFIGTRLKFSDLLRCLVSSCDIYKNIGFNDEAKYRMLRKEAIEDKLLSCFSLPEGLRSFNDLNCNVMRFFGSFETIKWLGEIPKEDHTYVSSGHPEVN